MPSIGNVLLCIVRVVYHQVHPRLDLVNLDLVNLDLVNLDLVKYSI